MKGTPSAPQCGFSRQLVSILRENQVKYGKSQTDSAVVAKLIMGRLL